VNLAGDINYIRNSVKVVLDVYEGELWFYVTEPGDPLVLTLQKIFPDLFLPLDQMSADLREHIRYPIDLFGVQAEQYLVYHMTDPSEFFNKADQWDLPREFFQDSTQILEPYYQNMRLPGEDQEEFVLLLPFTPVNKINMAGWLAARSDGDNYGKLLSFAFPKGVEVLGPEQVEANIAADSEITRYFTLACGGQARCIRGNLLVIPLEGEGGESQILYAEPLYLQAVGVPFPELKQVILADNASVVMECSLDGAVALLTGVLAVDPRDSPGGCLSEEVLASLPGLTSGAIVPGAAPSVGAPEPQDPDGSATDKGELERVLDEIMGAVEGLQSALGRLRGLVEGESP
jgi:hypothetical protein